ncbi:MAG: glycosyltransferase family 9 protein [Acidobacteriota bacterium]|nr:glycosyltransferase family 9 protein [Acidobacteriota bacterium]
MSRDNSQSAPPKVLIVKLGSFGDILHTIPAQQHIHQCRPDIEIHWLTEPPYAELLSKIPGITHVWVAATKEWRKKIGSLAGSIQLIRSLRKQHFDIALDFQGLVKSAVLARLSGAQQVIGFPQNQSKEPASVHFYSDTLTRNLPSKLHAIEINLELTRAVNCRPNGANPLIPLDIPPEAFTYIEQQLSMAKISSPILINPGAGWVTKRWPEQNYGRLLYELSRKLDRPVIITYGPGEEELVDRVKIAAECDVTTFPTNFFQLAALCRSSQLMVAGDTGPLHLAVALGTPTVAILGPTAPWRNGPFNPEDVIVKRYLPCSNSYKRTCDQFICMDIPVKDVFDAILRRLGK